MLYWYRCWPENDILRSWFRIRELSNVSHSDRCTLVRVCTRALTISTSAPHNTNYTLHSILFWIEILNFNAKNWVIVVHYFIISIYGPTSVFPHKLMRSWKRNTNLEDDIRLTERSCAAAKISHFALRTFLHLKNKHFITYNFMTVQVWL